MTTGVSVGILGVTGWTTGVSVGTLVVTGWTTGVSVGILGVTGWTTGVSVGILGVTGWTTGVSVGILGVTGWTTGVSVGTLVGVFEVLSVVLEVLGVLSVWLELQRAPVVELFSVGMPACKFCLSRGTRLSRDRSFLG